MAFPLLLLVLLGCLLLVASFRIRRRSGIPLGHVDYSDIGGGGQVLRSMRFALVGKPDYLVRRGGYLIPVEVKPGRQSARPFRSDVLQIAAYGLLVAETYGVEPPYGIIRYQRSSHKVLFGPELRRDLLDTLTAMRAAREVADVAPDHRSAAKCQACGYHQICASAESGHLPAQRGAD
jgi:CRISPR-associated exonuclease Cas4